MRVLAGLLLLTFGLACPASTTETSTSRAQREQRDRALIQQMRAAGSDMSQVHNLEHHFLASTQADLAGIARRAKSKAFSTTPVQPGASGFVMDVLTPCLPTETHVIANSALMASWALESDVTYDGWGAALIPKSP
jgi:regulator of RNase E activity RraB